MYPIDSFLLSLVLLFTLMNLLFSLSLFLVMRLLKFPAVFSLFVLPGFGRNKKINRDQVFMLHNSAKIRTG